MNARSETFCGNRSWPLFWILVLFLNIVAGTVVAAPKKFRRFYVFLSVAILASMSVLRARGEDVPTKESLVDVYAILKSLDSSQTHALEAALKKTCKAKLTTNRTARVMVLIFEELSRQRNLKHAENVVVIVARDRALALIDVAKRGVVAAKEARRIHKELATTIDFMRREVAFRQLDTIRRQKLYGDYEEGRLFVRDNSTTVAAHVLEAQGLSVVIPTEAERLKVMKSRVRDLIISLPGFGDWAEMALTKKLRTLLAGLGLHDMWTEELRSRVETYPNPVDFSNADLMRLFAFPRTLNEIGGTDASIVKKVRKTDDMRYEKRAVPIVDDETVNDFRKSVRETILAMYKDMQLPSATIRLFEDVLDDDLIGLPSLVVLRHDVGFHLRIGIGGAGRRDILRQLEKRRIISRSESRVGWVSVEQDSEDEIKRYWGFVKLLNGDVPVSLDADAGIRVATVKFPKKEVVFRLKVRYVCRALIKMELASYGALKPLEAVLGFPLLGRLAEPASHGK